MWPRMEEEARCGLGRRRRRGVASKGGGGEVWPWKEEAPCGFGRRRRHRVASEGGVGTVWPWKEEDAPCGLGRRRRHLVASDGGGGEVWPRKEEEGGVCLEGGGGGGEVWPRKEEEASCGLGRRRRRGVASEGGGGRSTNISWTLFLHHKRGKEGQEHITASIQLYKEQFGEEGGVQTYLGLYFSITSVVRRAKNISLQVFNYIKSSLERKEEYKHILGFISPSQAWLGGPRRYHCTRTYHCKYSII